MGITSSNKVVDRSEIQCDGQLKVTLALTASPDIIENPTDIVLVPDRSGSMAGVPLAAVKEGADTFIDIIQQATSNVGGSGELGSGTKMGVVSFATTARQDTAMITSVADLKGAVNALVAGGSTNHGDAFAQATDPDSIHVAIAPTPADLEEIFAELAANLTKPGATDLKIVEEVNPDFEITEILPLDKGTVEQQTDTKLTWRMDSLGVDAVESATLSFLIRRRSDTGGLKLVNQSIQYTDAQGKLVVFPDPTVRVGCDVIIHPEPCPTPVDVTVEGCTDAVVVDAGEIALDSVGRILQVDVTVKDVCPDRRVSLAMILTEVDDKGEKETKGVKVLTIPAHQEMGCRDVLVRCVRFAVPEDGANLCATRKFQVQTFAHYMDSDFVCCPDKE